MDVGAIMTRNPRTVGMDDTLKRMNDIFLTRRFHHLPVVDGNMLVGVISDRDILRASSPFLNTMGEQSRDVAALQKKAHQLMHRKPVCITADISVDDAVRLLLKENVTCLPVLTSDGCLEGIVTWKDLIRSYMEHM